MIHIVIPVHNRKDTTLECLAYLAKQTYIDYKIIVVDDGSTDGTAEAIQSTYPEITVLKGDGNLWWAGAMYMGIEHALSHTNDTDYILSLNDDVTMDPDYLEKLVTASTQHHNAVVGSLCRDSKDHSIIHDSGITMQWYKYRYGQLPFTAAVDVATGIDTVSGRGVLIPVSVVKQVGNFAKNSLPHYGADYELGFRIKHAGIPMVIANGAPVYLKVDLTGFVNHAPIVSYKDSLKELFYIKSPNNLRVHLYIIWKHCPGIGMKLFNIAYLLAGRAYLVLKNTLLYTLLKLHIIKEPAHV